MGLVDRGLLGSVLGLAAPNRLDRKTQQAADTVRALLAERPPRDERDTRERWLRPMVAALGYRAQELPATDGGAPAWRLAASGGSAVVFLGRRVGRSLERLAGGNRDLFQPTNPEFALLRALVAHGDGWAILSDGQRWRLYHRHTGLLAHLELTLERAPDPSSLAWLVALFGSQSLCGRRAGASNLDRLWQRRVGLAGRGRMRRKGKLAGRLAGPILPWDGVGAGAAVGALPWASLGPVVSSLTQAGAATICDPLAVERVCWIGRGGLRLARMLGAWIAHALVLKNSAVDDVAARIDGSGAEFERLIEAIYRQLFVGILTSGRGAGESGSRVESDDRLLGRARRGNPLLGAELEELLAGLRAQEQRRAGLFDSEGRTEVEALRQDLRLWALLGAGANRARSEQRLSRALGRSRDLLDLWLARRRFQRPRLRELQWLLLATRTADARWRCILGRPPLARALERIRRLEPLHWELEFPRVFHPASGPAGFALILASAGPHAELTSPYARRIRALMKRLRPSGWLWLEASPRSAAAVYRAALRVSQGEARLCRRPRRDWVLVRRGNGQKS